jgi:hypothetical protein
MVGRMRQSRCICQYVEIETKDDVAESNADQHSALTWRGRRPDGIPAQES